tara:strand:+ start:117 stop:425 length:309 start_codon:yes stop_codon:yes gene_type:complete
MSVIAPGSDWDIKGCIISAGYSWCNILGRCIRAWEEVCQIPDNCLTWSDGCNACSVENGQLTVCSEMACFAMGTPECLVWAPQTPVFLPIDHLLVGLAVHNS